MARCEKIRSEWDGLLHPGVIYYIQNRMPLFILKAAIYRVLDRCPSVWSEDLPELVKAGKKIKITKKMKKEFEELNEELLFPVQGGEIVRIIELAKEFLNKEGKKKLPRRLSK